MPDEASQPPQVRSAPFTALLLGALAGGLSGFLGVGAGFLLVPLLALLLRVRGGVAAGTALTVTLPASLVGALQYGVRDWWTVLLLSVGCVLGAVVGGSVSRKEPVRLQRRWLGLIFLAAGAWLMATRGPAPGSGPPSWFPLGPVGLLLMLGLGVASGLLSALANTGAGVVLVPLLALGAGMPQWEAQGLALAVTLPVSLPGAALHGARGNVAGNLLGPLCVGAVLGTVLLSYLAHGVGPGTLRLVYGLFLLAVGVSTVMTRPQPKADPP